MPPDVSTEHDQSKSFPWQLGIYDAHCHPTDTMGSIADIPSMKASILTVMATRGEDQDLVFNAAAAMTRTTLAETETENRTSLSSTRSIQREREGTIEGGGRIIPCFGWHPWFSYQLIVDLDIDSKDGLLPQLQSSPSPVNNKIDHNHGHDHYKIVLTPSPTTTDTNNPKSFLSSLPPPRPLSQFLSETKARLLSFPYSLVGEVGLDRAFRLPNPWSDAELESRDVQLTPGSREGRSLSPYKVQLSHQKAVLKAQLRLAGELRRPVSVHSVQAHGAVLDVLRELWKGHERKVLSKRERKRMEEAGPSPPSSSSSSAVVLPFPPRICMHSYSGPVEQLRLFLDPTVPSDIYFSFSSVINLQGPTPHKVLDVIKSLPENRLLIESDLHTAGAQMDALLEDVTRTICHEKGWSLEQGVQRLAENWKAFVFG